MKSEEKTNRFYFDRFFCCCVKYNMRETKSMYDILIKLSRWTIFCYYLRSIMIGLWVLLKWLFQFLWHSIQQSTTKNRPQTLFDYHSCLCDKPPPCLVDNKIGLQSYVKLKGTKLHYIEAGNQTDPLILLLHGFPDCWLGSYSTLYSYFSIYFLIFIIFYFLYIRVA